MIRTLSLCPTCYKKIPAYIVCIQNKAVMVKECDVHGKFEAIVEPDYTFMSERYQYGTLGNNNNLILNIEDACNMKCEWCYYDLKKPNYKPFEHYEALLRTYNIQKYGWMLSGGEPTIRADYFEFIDKAAKCGIGCTTLSNGLSFADKAFLQEYVKHDYNPYNFLDLVISLHTPKQNTTESFDLKIQALENIRSTGKKLQCIGFSITSLDEVKTIRELYDEFKDVTVMFRIRTMFDNWANKGEKKLFLSDLYKAFMSEFADQTPIRHDGFEKSTFYCMYLQLSGGNLFSLTSAPTVENIDYHICSRPVNMLANDQKCYPVPIAQIVNEGLGKGWYAGYKLEV